MFCRSILFGVSLLLFALAPERSSAQTQAATGDPHENAPVVRTVRAQGPVVVDGRLDEPAWSLASPVTEFTQLDPAEGAPATERTEVRILFDDEALYIGAMLYDSGEVRRNLGRHDAYFADSDWFTVSLDSYHDHLTAYQFRINPAGVRGDEVLSGFLPDPSWDPVWEGKAAVTDSGWVAELRIPFSQLRFSRVPGQTWGIQLERSISRKQERVVLAFTPKMEFGGVARYGHLVGLEGLQPGRRLEILPYTAARAEYVNTTPGNPFRTGSEYFARAGMDLKYRVTSNMILDAAINPDFGQVELDPAVVNLTAFETFYQEKRPFFVEGAEIFNFGGAGGLYGGDQIFYSRRIGRAPWVWPAGAVNADLPEASTILGAAKLTGKTAGGWSVGVLDAVTAPASARYIDLVGDEHRATVEPLSNYFVGRLRRDLRGGQSSVGGMITAVHRDLGDEFLASQLRSAAYAGGVDFRHDWGQRAWSLTGYITSSFIAGEPAVMEAAQRSPARYFQRPDAEYLNLDTAATSLSGYAAQLAINRQAGRHWRGGVTLSATSPGYETNDLGFLSLADRLGINANLRYVENRPGTRFRNWSISGGPNLSWNYGGDRLGSHVNLSASGQHLNYWSGSFSFGRTFAALDDRLTRGGPLTRTPASNSVSANVQSDPRKSVSGFGFTSYRWDTAGGRSLSGSMNLGLRPATNWNISLGPTFTRSHSVGQYVATVRDATTTHTYGHRYVFANLDHTTLGIETRLNVTFTPQLSLELYAQPYLSSGDYQNLKELHAPRTFSFARYGTDIGTIERDNLGFYIIDPDAGGPAPAFRISDRDFNFLSLRGNAVLRWEWRPGSTLFLVWQQRRADYLGAFNVDPDYEGLGRFDLQRDARELLEIKPDNIFLIKINYWLNP